MSSRRLAWLVLAGFLCLAGVGVVWLQSVRPHPQAGQLPEVGVTPAESAAQFPETFVEITQPAGLAFQHDSGPWGAYFFPQIMGSGGAFWDYDQDGDLDIYLIQGAGQPNQEQRARNQLFRQEADGTFRDVSPGSGLDVPGGGMGVAVGDLNNDGLPDLLLSNYGPDQLFLNQGGGTFRDVSREARIDDPSWGASACFLDFDRDGWLDLCVTNYVDYDPGQRCVDQNSRPDFCNPKLFLGTATKLYRNVTGENSQASGTHAPPIRFEDVSLQSKIAQRKGPGLGVVSLDFNQDGWQDLYVANDGAANHLWINQRDGTFREEAVIRGAAYDNQGRPQAGMGIAAGDVDRDGDVDLLITHLRGEYNTLYLNDPAVSFRDATAEAGLAFPSFQLTGFGTAWLDLELDGDLDLVLVNGDVRRDESQRAVPVSETQEGRLAFYEQPNQILMNTGSGQFQAVIPETQEFCRRREISRALLTGDIDNDGDLDLMVTNISGPARLYRNQARRQGHWLLIRAIEPGLGGRDAYGARIAVQAGPSAWTGWVNPGGSYLSSSDPRVHFGLGETVEISEIEVTWPNGDHERFPGGAVDRRLTLQHGAGMSP